LAIQARANTAGLARLGFIIPKRVVARAVDRNRLKRVLREWFRQNRVRLGSRDLLVRVTATPEQPLAAMAELVAKLP
jgi:ribonuclease P protein component